MNRLARNGMAVAFVLFSSIIFAANAVAQVGLDVVGKVSRVQTAAVAMQDAVPRSLSPGSEVYLGDVISTGKGARLEIVMTDGGEVTLGEKTHFVVQEFVMSNQGGNAVMRLLEGAFSVTSGKLMQSANASLTVETNLATIGIRGTTFWGGTLDGKFEIALLDGKGVYVETKAGRVELDTVGEGTLVESASKAPTAPVKWADEKTARAVATVTFDN